MKKTVLFLGALIAFSLTAMADEGMWLPSLISQRIGDMQAKGFRLTAEDVYSVNQASLKDAVVLFGSGCTGELVSDEGLLLTNHHCGYSYIQRHSSVEHDYLKDGFWAMNRNQELPNRGLTVSFLERMDDVTELVLKGYQEGMTEAQRDSVVRANTRKLTAEAVSAGKGLTANVEALFYGNQYFLFVFKVFRDVRLVGAPPSSIGKFGGDTDNWMWPRHTGPVPLQHLVRHVFHPFEKADGQAPVGQFLIAVHRPETILEVIVLHTAVALDVAVSAVVVRQEKAFVGHEFARAAAAEQDDGILE